MSSPVSWSWEAEKRQAKVTCFRAILKGMSASAEIDAILEDGTHIQASAGNFDRPRRMEVKIEEASK